MEYGILGPLAVWKEGRELRLGGPKQRSVLAVLLLRPNELVPTARLVDELWGDQPPSTAVKAVQIHVSQLRKALGEGVVETRPTGYLLRLDTAALDSQRFEDLLEQGRRLLAEGAAEEAVRVLREALALWRGPPLAEFQYEAFARNEIGRLEELRLVVLELRLEADLALGRNAEVAGELEALVRDHPLRESLCGLLILALYRAGRQADALAAYQDARARLVAALGLDPSQALQRLEKAILLQDASLDLAAVTPANPDVPRELESDRGELPRLKSLYRSNLPVPATPFLGREPELATLAAMLSEPGARLISLTGPGGTGKTRLALQGAAEASDVFRDGMFWAPFATLRDPRLVLPEVSAAVGVREGEGGSALDDLGKALAGKRLLVILDNIEHLLPEAAVQIGGFVAACPSVTVMVTSRERLKLPGERVFAVPPMSETDGEALFRRRAADAGVELEDAAELRTLCTRLDNLPLALELAAVRMLVFSPTQLLDRLSQRLDLLKGVRGADARQETLRATIAWSHELLDVDEQQLFRRLSVFAGGCSYDSAEKVADADPDTLQSLLDKSLLRRSDSPTGPRFWMLETIREYAADELAAAGETKDFRRRHLEHYATLAADCYDEDWGGNDDLERVETERDNLRFALDIAFEADSEVALALATHLTPDWSKRGENREGGEKLAAALALAPDSPTPSRAAALLASSRLAGQQVDVDAAETHSLAALELSRALGDQLKEGRALSQLAIVAFRRGELDDARRLADDAVDKLGIPGGEATRQWALATIANVLSQLGDHPGALARQRELVASTRNDGSALRLAVLLNSLGNMERAAGEIVQARRSVEESVALLRQSGSKPALAASLHTLASVLRGSTPAAALAALSESLGLVREMDGWSGIAYCLEGAASIFADGGVHDHAVSLLAAASSIRIRVGDPREASERADSAAVELQCRQMLTPDAFTRAWAQGAALDANAAADWALEVWEREIATLD